MTITAVDKPLSPLRTGVRCRCPRCGQGRLFRGFLKLAPSCEACGLDYGFADPADGPAFFVMSLVSLAVMAFAMWFDFTFHPPLWTHLVTTLPLIVLSGLALLRPFKGWMVASQYRWKAEEARWESTGKHGPF